MTPEIEDFDFDLEYETEGESSKTYKIDFENNRITGMIDGIEAIKQAVYKILNTERYNCLIYSWDYGIEIESLIGKDYDFIIGDLERRIEEALIQDDRIEEITNFEFTTERNTITVNFTVVSVEGNFDVEKVVNF